MIQLTNTPNYAGVSIQGDFYDLEALYDALHVIVGEEGEFPAFDAARIRVLGLCYDLRHALMGDRDIAFVNNGMDRDKMKAMSTMAPERNVYYKVNALWPELIFITMALNDFVKQYAARQTKNAFDPMMKKEVLWDRSIPMVRLFQASIADCLRELVTPSSYSRMMNLIKKEYSWTNGYMVQYIDVLNVRYLDMDREKRLKNLTVMAKRMAEFGEEYRQLEQEVRAAARAHQVHPDMIQAPVEYPDNIDW